MCNSQQEFLSLCLPMPHHLFDQEFGVHMLLEFWLTTETRFSRADSAIMTIYLEDQRLFKLILWNEKMDIHLFNSLGLINLLTDNAINQANRSLRKEN